MKRTVVTIATALALFAGAPLLHAQPEEEIPVPADKSAIVMNFENVELTAFIKFISKISSRNIVFGDRIEGTVSVISPTPVNVEQAFAMFQSVLATQGLTTVDEGGVMRIVASKDARTSGGAVVQRDSASSGFATRLFPLRYVSAEDIARVLAPQISKDGSIVPYQGTNTVIVSDSGANLARLDEMVRAMDIPGHEQNVAVIPLRHAEAARTAEQIVDILLGNSGGSSGGGGRRRGGDKDKSAAPASADLGFKITPDERTNSLVVMAPPTEMARLRTLARALDTEIRPGEERIHVYYAKNADAEALVEVVSGMLLGSKAQSRRDKTTKKDAGSTSSPTPPSAPPSASDDSMSITADAATNAVIVSGSAQDWKSILGLLEKLDIPRPQVFIEAIIVEASANRAKALGLDYQGALDVGAGDILLRSNIAQLSSAFINPLALGGLVAAAASDKQIVLPDGTELPANYALLQALDQTSDVEVLSAPTLLTLDNQEAEIIVGQNIPFVTGRASDIININSVLTTVERKDVGIKLRVRPQVAEGDIVILDVMQEVSALVRNGLTEAQLLQVGPITTIRSASTSVSVGDGRTVVIGGLISNRIEQGESKVPLLGDIPWIGRLFRYERKDKDKVNLIIFLTPHVIRSPRDLDYVTGDRRERFREQMTNSGSKLPGDVPELAPDATGEADSLGGTGSLSAAVQPRAAVQPAAAPQVVPRAAGADSDAARHESTYRHANSDKNANVYPLNKDTRERAPF